MSFIRRGDSSRSGGEMHQLKGHFHQLVNNFRSQAHYQQQHGLMRVTINRGASVGVGVDISTALAGSDCSRFRSQS